MYRPLIAWDIYEIRTERSPIHGVMFRGRVRKYALMQGRNLLAENASDAENAVRFAVPADEDISDIERFLKEIVVDVSVERVREAVLNPVLSKLKVNIEERYTL